MQPSEGPDYATEARKALQKGDTASALVWATLAQNELIESVRWALENVHHSLQEMTQRLH